MRTTGKVTVELTGGEGLVLFEFLARHAEVGAYPIAHRAEQTVLWRLEGALETQLVEIFRPDYRQLLDEARAQVGGAEPEPPVDCPPPHSAACCQDMEAHLSWRCERHQRPEDCPDCIIRYYPGRGRYGIPVHDGGSAYIAINHCPWCGAHLAASPGS